MFEHFLHENIIIILFIIEPSVLALTIWLTYTTFISKVVFITDQHIMTQYLLNLQYRLRIDETCYFIRPICFFFILICMYA